MSCAGALLVTVAIAMGQSSPSELAPVEPKPGAMTGVAAGAEPDPPIVPDLGRASPPRVVERAGTVERVILGPLRAEVSSGQAVLADDRFAFPITGAARTRGGWLFVAADGTVARSDRFLGPLERFGEVPRPDPRIKVQPRSPTCGRLAIGVVDPRASLWTSDGSAPIAPAAGAPAGVVLAAAFADRDHGMIVLDGGELFATQDGAASFERVDLGQAAASDVACVHGALRVTSSQGALVFAPGALHGRPVQHGDDGGDGDAPSTEPLRAPILAAALARRRTSGRVLVSPAAAPEAPRRQVPEPKLFPVAVGRPRPPVFERYNDQQLDEDGQTHLRRANADATLQVTPDGTWRFTWHGFDWQGAYGERHSSGKLALPRAGDYLLDRATREGAVISYYGNPAREIWLPAGRPPVEIADAMLYDGAGGIRTEDLLTLPDGSLALLFSSSRLHETAAYHRLLHVDRDGRVIAQRTLYWDAEWRSNGKHTGIAIIGGALGVQWVPQDPRFPRWFLAIDATRPRSEVVTDPIMAALCRPGARGALTVAVGWGEDHRVFLRGGRAGAAMCEQAEEMGNGLDRLVFAVVSPYGDLRTTMYAGEVRGYRWAEASAR